ncbi:MAG: fumarate/nitrate reduction transcriptional regulator Fnr [Granulosicoccaceae bacterium]
MAGNSPTLKCVHVKPACEECGVRRLCLPVGLDGEELFMMDRLVRRRNKFNKGDYLFRAGDPFRSIYAIKYGSMKSYGVTRDGKEQVTGFHLTGELLGLDAIDTENHQCNAVALETTEVCELPFASLEELQHELPSLQHEFSRIMSREIVRDQHMLMMIGSTGAEQRIARFLLNLHERMRVRGNSSDELHLSMTRQDIGNYLGLAFETVSRQLAHLQELGLLRIENRTIRLLDSVKLEALAL